MRLVIFAIYFFILISCSHTNHEGLNSPEYLKYYFENINLFEFTADSNDQFDYSLKYNPIEFLIAKEVIQGDFSNEVILDNYEGFRYVQFKISSKTGNLISDIQKEFGYENENDMMNNHHFNLASKFKLIIEGRELIPAYYHLEINQIGSSNFVFNIVYQDASSKLNSDLTDDAVFKFMKDRKTPLAKIVIPKQKINYKPRLSI